MHSLSTDGLLPAASYDGESAPRRALPRVQARVAPCCPVGAASTLNQALSSSLAIPAAAAGAPLSVASHQLSGPEPSSASACNWKQPCSAPCPTHRSRSSSPRRCSTSAVNATSGLWRRRMPWGWAGRATPTSGPPRERGRRLAVLAPTCSPQAFCSMQHGKAAVMRCCKAADGWSRAQGTGHRAQRAPLQ